MALKIMTNESDTWAGLLNVVLKYAWVYPRERQLVPFSERRPGEFFARFINSIRNLLQKKIARFF